MYIHTYTGYQKLHKNPYKLNESSHTPRSNIAWECCIQWMANPSISDGQLERGYTCIAPHKDQISISCKNAYLHIIHNYTLFITTKFHAILLSGVSGVVLTNCSSSIFHFRQISKFKKGHTCSSQKKMILKCSVDMHIYTLCPS